jgi:hypothetical protein
VYRIAYNNCNPRKKPQEYIFEALFLVELAGMTYFHAKELKHFAWTSKENSNTHWVFSPSRDQTTNYFTKVKTPSK